MVPWNPQASIGGKLKRGNGAEYRSVPLVRSREAYRGTPESKGQLGVPPVGLTYADTVDEKMAGGSAGNEDASARPTRKRHFGGALVALVAFLVFIANAISPPRLMDDVDAVQAQIARNMLQSGDYVTARLDGVAYLEKAPLVYWAMAGSYKIF